MEEKVICCCGASGWTRVIAWLEIIGAGLTMILLTFALIFFVGAATADLNDLNTRETFTPEQIQTMEYVSTGLIAIITIFLILALLAFVMAFILLRGSHTQNPHDIQAWMVYTGICLIITTVLGFIAFFVEPSLGVTVLFQILIQGFFLWVVGTHKKEIEAAHRPMYSVKI